MGEPVDWQADGGGEAPGARVFGTGLRAVRWLKGGEEQWVAIATCQMCTGEFLVNPGAVARLMVEARREVPVEDRGEAAFVVLCPICSKRVQTYEETGVLPAFDILDDPSLDPEVMEGDDADQPVVEGDGEGREA